MKTIGLIGGMSWQSSAEYYRLINDETQRRLGGHHNARSLLLTLDFHDIEAMQRSGNWDGAAALLADAARKLERAGADIIVLCTNTMHKLADAVVAAISVPLLHVADATAAEVRDAKLKRVGLLGTRFTLQEDFYRRKLEENGLEILIPDKDDIPEIDRIIFEELCFGRTLDESRRHYLEVIRSLKARGAQGVVLGCTEIGLLIKQRDTALPVFDTTRIHARAAVKAALA